MKKNMNSNKIGKTNKSSPANIVNGRLYAYKGVVVRAKKLCNNGLRFVTSHKKLNGFVRDEDLVAISKEQVAEYVDNA